MALSLKKSSAAALASAREKRANAKPAPRAKKPGSTSSKPEATNKRKYFCLMIGDEGGILIFMDGAKVVRRLFTPTPQPASTKAMLALMREYPDVPLTLLVDSLDQQYVRQSFPPVSSFSLPKLVKRRMDRDFLPEDIKGYLPLGRDKTGRKEWNFLLIALNRTPAIAEWIELLIELPNEFKGIYLTPTESILYVNTLNQLTATEGCKPWQLLVTHNKVSGFRQVVVNEGKLVFTRVTQAMDDSIPAVISGNIEQEITNTIEYLRRLGFQDTMGLDIVVVAASDVNESLDLKRFKLGNAQALSPLDVADLLGFEQAALSADRFGDVVLAASFARQRRRVLRLSTPYMQSLRLLYQAKRGIKIGCSVISACILFLVLQNVVEIAQQQSSWQTIRDKRKALQPKLEVLTSSVSGLNKNLAFKSAVVTAYDAYIKDTHLPTEFVEALAKRLSTEERVLSMKWETPATAATAAPGAQTTGPHKITVEIEFRGVYQDIDALAKAEEKFLGDLTAAMPEYTITHNPFPWLSGDKKNMEISFDQIPNVGIQGTDARLTLTFVGPKRTPDAANVTATPPVGGRP